MLKNIRLFSLHKLQVIRCQFKWSFLEVQIAWRIRQNETEINMDDMSF